MYLYESSMLLEIDIIYLVEKIPENDFSPAKYVIKAPDSFDQIAEDYGIVVSTTFAELYPERIVLLQGNEREKVKKGQYSVYAFEKIHKIKGKNFKKYRFSAEEVKAMYNNAPHPSIDTLSDERYRKKHSAGSLACLEFSHVLLAGKRTWGIILDSEPRSVYDLRHDFIKAKPEGDIAYFNIVQEYPLDDVSVVFNYGDELSLLLPNAWNGDLIALEKVRSLIGVEI